MALPAGVTTCLVFKKAPVSFGGGQAKVSLDITPSARLVHTETGTPFADFVESIAPTEGGIAQLQLPHTGQPGFQDEAGNAVTNWHYTARIRLEKSGHQAKTLPLFSFQIPPGQTDVDLSTIPHGAPALPTSAPIATVTSVAGLTGAVTGAQIAELPELSGTYATKATGPAWATTEATWDPRMSVYNATPQTLRKWRAALAKASGGLGQAHISTHIDSITMGATSQAPVSQRSWPGRLRRMMEAAYGSGGTGIVVPWNLYGSAAGSPSLEPRFTYPAANVSNRADYGIYGKGGLQIQAGAAVTFGPVTCDEFWLYLASPEDTLAKVDNGALMILASNAYATKTTATGRIVYRFAAPPEGAVLGQHTLTINGYTTTVFGVEGRIKDKGVRVSNLGLNGESTISGAIEDAAGLRGMSIGIDMAKADLAVMLLSMNDYQSHVTVAGFKDRTRTMILRQKAAGGDVLLATCPQPDYTQIPGDGVQVPPLSDYFKALYELADEEGVALLDMASRWESYTASQPYFSDSLHPNDLGAEDIARAVYNAVTSV